MFGGMVVKRWVKFWSSNQIIKFCMILVQNSLRYLDIITFKRICDGFVFRIDLCKRN